MPPGHLSGRSVNIRSMTDGFGAGFGALMLLALLVGLAALLSVTAAGALLSERRSDDVHDVFPYTAVGLVSVVVVVGGFGVLALSDEAPAAAALFVALVFVPLAGAAGVLQRDTALSWDDLAAVAGMAWGLPYVAGAAVLFGLAVGLAPALGLAPGEARRTGLPWIETVVAGLVVLAGAMAVAPRLVARLPSVTPDRERSRYQE